MISDITLGQFFPGNSLIHRLDARIKIICMILYIAAIFTASSYVSFALVALTTVAIVLLSRLDIGIILKGLKPLKSPDIYV